MNPVVDFPMELLQPEFHVLIFLDASPRDTTSEVQHSMTPRVCGFARQLAPRTKNKESTFCCYPKMDLSAGVVDFPQNVYVGVVKKRNPETNIDHCVHETLDIV